jgi:ABC-type bacteriocin/lantibiotic exporter with double-glycine peptidase domain
MFKRLKKLFPYLWPYKHVGLQFLAVLAIIIVLIGRFVNIGIPVSLKAVVSALEKQRMEPRPSPWKPLFFYVGFRFLAGSGGLGSIRDMLWAPVMQYSDRQMSQLSFDHLLNLSLAFHTRRKTGEVLRILDRGAAINHIFEVGSLHLC